MTRFIVAGCLILFLAARVVAADPAYTAEMEKWRRDFDADVRAGGWLTCIGRFEVPEGRSTLGSGRGSSIRLAPLHATKTLGVLTRHAKSIRFAPAHGIRATIDGHPVKKTTALSLRSGTGKVRIGSLEFRVREIGDVYYLFIDDLKNPAIANFKGNSWFAIDDSYRVPARFVAYEEPEEVRIPMTHIEWKKPMQSTGDVVFTLGGQEVRLKSFISDNELLVMFTDQTNGNETYGGGRFINAPAPRDGTTVLDFNKAFNPYCSLNEYVMCPIPPSENRLAFRVTAGETYSGHD